MANIQLYGTDWCTFSRGFRRYFEQRDLSYRFFDVEQDPLAAEAARAMNGGKLKFPMVVVGEVAGYWQPGLNATVLKNPRLPELQLALQQAGL